MNCTWSCVEELKFHMVRVGVVIVADAGYQVLDDHEIDWYTIEKKPRNRSLMQEKEDHKSQTTMLVRKFVN